MTGPTGFFAGTAYTNRTYKKDIESHRERANMSLDDIRQAKNKRCKQRNETRRRERIKATDRRSQAWQALSPKAQIAELDRRLGVGVGATKQRAKIQHLIDNPPQPKEKVETVVKTGHQEHKHYQKKGKSKNKHQQYQK